MLNISKTVPSTAVDTLHKKITWVKKATQSLFGCPIVDGSPTSQPPHGVQQACWHNKFWLMLDAIPFEVEHTAAFLLVIIILVPV